MFAELGFGLLKELGCSRSGPECPRAPTAHKNRHPAWPPGLLVIPRPQAHASSCCPLWDDLGPITGPSCVSVSRLHVGYMGRPHGIGHMRRLLGGIQGFISLS